MSKGSGRRPTDEKQYHDNYDAIFNKKKPLEQQVFEDQIKPYDNTLAEHLIKGYEHGSSPLRK
jgi:hypothetical protein